MKLYSSFYKFLEKSSITDIINAAKYEWILESGENYEKKNESDNYGNSMLEFTA